MSAAYLLLAMSSMAFSAQSNKTQETTGTNEDHCKALSRLLPLSTNVFVSMGMLFVSPIWFKYEETESPHWTWTPFRSSDLHDQEQQWIPVSNDTVPYDIKVTNLLAGLYRGQKPVRFNRLIIEYLNKHEPHPDDIKKCKRVTLARKILHNTWGHHYVSTTRRQEGARRG